MEDKFVPWSLEMYREFDTDAYRISYLMVMMTGANKTMVDEKQERADFHECIQYLCERGCCTRNDGQWALTGAGASMAEEFIGYGSGRNCTMSNLVQDEKGMMVSGRNPFVILYARWIYKDLEKEGLCTPILVDGRIIGSTITPKGLDTAKKMMKESEQRFREDMK